jgi:hypothetical protein
MSETFAKLHDYRVALVDGFAAQPAELAELLQPLTEAASRTPRVAGGNTLHQVLAHLRDVEIHAFLPRFRRLLAEDKPELEPFASPDWTADRYQFEEALPAILAEFTHARAEAVTLMRAMRPEDWARLGFHPPTGWRTTQWWVEHIYRHAREHLLEVQRALTTTTPSRPANWHIADNG